MIQDNEKLRAENDELEQNIKKTRIDIEEIQQKIELNAMLKDIDINELNLEKKMIKLFFINSIIQLQTNLI